MGIYALRGNLHSYWLPENQMDVFCGNLQSDWLFYYKMDILTSDDPQWSDGP
jgi:hypothetical protein